MLSKKSMLLELSKIYSKIHSYYLTSTSGLDPEIRLNHVERTFYLKLKNILKDENLIIYDIGAASGIFSNCLAKFPNVKEIHAFEPIPFMYEKLKVNLNNSPKVISHNVGLGDSCFKSKMYVNSLTDTSSLLHMNELHEQEVPRNICVSDTTEISVVPLDEYKFINSLPQPSIIKIDVQGYEDRVIDGGREVISQSNFCIIEMSLEPLYEDSCLFDDVYKKICGLGFKLYDISPTFKGRASGRQLQVDGIFRRIK